MAITNETKGISLQYRVLGAANPVVRLIGLLGTSNPDRGKALYITPCTGVHTFGMEYPVDIVFLSREGKVVALKRHLRPNRVTGVIRSARNALEFPSDTILDSEIRVGDHLVITVDEQQRLSWNGLGVLLHWPFNFCIAVLWFLLVYASYLKWQQTGQMLGLGLVLVNTVVCILFLIRRRSTETSHRIQDWVVPFVTVLASMLLRPEHGSGTFLAVVSLPLQMVGVAALLVSLLSLGRSFGLIPANRGIKERGLYRVVRHPVYASELTFYIGFLLVAMTLRNVQLVVLIAVGQVYRIVSEERLLSRDDKYRDYMKKVKYRLLPGIF